MPLSFTLRIWYHILGDLRARKYIQFKGQQIHWNTRIQENTQIYFCKHPTHMSIKRPCPLLCTFVFFSCFSCFCFVGRTQGWQSFWCSKTKINPHHALSPCYFACLFLIVFLKLNGRYRSFFLGMKKPLQTQILHM